MTGRQRAQLNQRRSGCPISRRPRYVRPSLLPMYRAQSLNTHCRQCLRCPAMMRMLTRLIAALLVVLALGPASALGVVLAQIDPQVRDRAVPAIVEIAILLNVR